MYKTILSSAALAALCSTALLAGNPTFKGVAGKVSFEGDRPEVKPLAVDAKAAEGCSHGDAKVSDRDEKLLIDKDGGIANVVIMLKVEGATAKPAEKPLVLDQKTCRFEPHVTVIPVGTTVEFANSDSVSHNVHTYAKKNEPMNKTIPAGAKETQKLDLVDQIEIKCDIHPWMNGWLVVTDTPHFAVSGPDGSFSVAGVPAGTHKVDYWHESLGRGTGEVVVKEDGTADALALKMGAKKEGGGRRR